MSLLSQKKINKNELKGLSPNSKKLKQYKESLSKLSQTQWEAAIGLMLGSKQRACYSTADGPTEAKSLSSSQKKKIN